MSRSHVSYFVSSFERGIIRERVNAGLARARASGTKLNRRRVKPSVEARTLDLRANGDGIRLPPAWAALLG
jgi:DNA invertase Pin-like site-specific DNA recombinase